jgi:protein CpxP
MKRLLLVCCFVVGISAASHAQRRTPEESTAALKTSLSLTDDQSAKVLAIYQSRAKTVDSLINSANGDPSSLRPGFMKLTTTTDTKIKAILTPDQVTAYQKIADAQAAAMKARMQGGN